VDRGPVANRPVLYCMRFDSSGLRKVSLIRLSMRRCCRET
jgi:hypothetical protein